MEKKYKKKSGKLRLFSGRQTDLWIVVKCYLDFIFSQQTIFHRNNNEAPRILNVFYLCFHQWIKKDEIFHENIYCYLVGIFQSIDRKRCNLSLDTHISLIFPDWYKCPNISKQLYNTVIIFQLVQSQDLKSINFRRCFHDVYFLKLMMKQMIGSGIFSSWYFCLKRNVMRDEINNIVTFTIISIGNLFQGC